MFQNPEFVRQMTNPENMQAVKMTNDILYSLYRLRSTDDANAAKHGRRSGHGYGHAGHAGHAGHGVGSNN
jgi:hypothetical protein